DKTEEETEETIASGGGGVSGTVPNAISELGLAGVVPGTLALSAFPVSSDTASLNLAEESDTYVSKPPKEKVAENEKRLLGEAESCFDPSQFPRDLKDTNIDCYNFDSDMNPMRYDAMGQTVNFGTIDGKHTNGEACMVAFARKEIQSSVQMIDRAMALFTGMICQAQKSGVVGFPAVGEELDLKEVFAEATGDRMPTTAAKIVRLKDGTDGSPVSRSDIEIQTPEGKSLVLHLAHSPKDPNNSKGTLWFQQPEQGEQAPKLFDPNNESNKNHVVSVRYENSLDDEGNRYISLELSRAGIVDTVEPFEEDGDINFSAIPDDAGNEQLHAINYVAYDGYPDTNSGNLSYWMNPGGRFEESARGFLFNNSAQDDGTLAGCGVSGATSNISIRKSISNPEEFILQPTRYWHPTPGADGNMHPDKDPRFDSDQGSKITKQCFTQDANGL
ncbi:MAG: hypothetical protein D3907_03835, partial [Candidatus Electrothrix sp. AUS3]|nr:hypothetical protein [Candidatus Electrothrix gigas]